MTYHNNSISATKAQLQSIDGTAIDEEFPIEFANEIAKIESYNKHLYRPNTYLHKWWARRCGSTFRLILKHLADDSDNRNYYAPGGLENKVILDPMMGGGTTLHESIRLGANVIGVDIDPIPILQARATMSQISVDALEEVFYKFYESLRTELENYYATSCPHCADVTEFMYILYGQKQGCGCGFSVVIDSKVLRYESDGSRVEICDTCGEIYIQPEQNSSFRHSCKSDPLPFAILEKGSKICPQCNEFLVELKGLPFYERYSPIAVVGQCIAHGLFFKKPKPKDLSLIKFSNSQRPSINFQPIDGFDVIPGPKSIDLVRHGIHSYLDLFSTRQLLYLESSVEFLNSLNDLTKLNLGLLVSTSTEFNSMLCGYKGGARGRPGAIRHVFSHHAYSFPYTALENNPLYPKKISGSLQSLFHSRIRRAKNWANQPKERSIHSGRVEDIIEIDGELDFGAEVSTSDQLTNGSRKFLLFQESSIKLNLDSNSVDHIVTDPPYFDNIQYSDLSAFFRVWLKRIFHDDARWDFNLDGSAAEPKNNGRGQFEKTLRRIFLECHRVLKKKKGRLVFTFHHWNPRGWSSLTIALKNSGFMLMNQYVIHAENPASVHISNLKSLEHDAILVLCSRQSTRSREWHLPSSIDKSNSRLFVSSCANLLGWMLDANISSHEIAEMWKKFLS